MSKLSYEAVSRAKSSGELPHEFLLRIVRGEKIGETSPSLEQRIHAAIASAPYFAPKLTAIEQRVENHVKAVISSEPLTTEEWMAKYGVERAALPATP